MFRQGYRLLCRTFNTVAPKVDPVAQPAFVPEAEIPEAQLAQLNQSLTALEERYLRIHRARLTTLEKKLEPQQKERVQKIAKILDGLSMEESQLLKLKLIAACK